MNTNCMRWLFTPGCKTLITDGGTKLTFAFWHFGLCGA